MAAAAAAAREGSVDRPRDGGPGQLRRTYLSLHKGGLCHSRPRQAPAKAGGGRGRDVFFCAFLLAEWASLSRAASAAASREPVEPASGAGKGDVAAVRLEQSNPRDIGRGGAVAASGPALAPVEPNSAREPG